MKKIFILFMFMFMFMLLVMSCTKADFVSIEKNNKAASEGLVRKVTVYSAYTGKAIFEKVFSNSYFTGTASNGSDIDILDLKTKMKTSIIGDNAIIIIEEIEWDKNYYG